MQENNVTCNKSSNKTIKYIIFSLNIFCTTDDKTRVNQYGRLTYAKLSFLIGIDRMKFFVVLAIFLYKTTGVQINFVS